MKKIKLIPVLLGALFLYTSSGFGNTVTLHIDNYFFFGMKACPIKVCIDKSCKSVSAFSGSDITLTTDKPSFRVKFMWPRKHPTTNCSKSGVKSGDSLVVSGDYPIIFCDFN